MRNAFTRVGSAVDDDAVTALLDTKFLGQITGDEQKLPQDFLIRFRCCSQTRNHFLGHNQNMEGRLRIDVVKSDSVVIFPDNFRGNLARYDLLKDGHESEFLRSTINVTNIPSARVRLSNRVSRE